jgi:hypothetical protein
VLLLLGYNYINCTTAENDIIVVGDVNFHLENLSNPNTPKLKSVLEACGMRQHVTEPTHVAGHILDVLITRDTDSTVSNIEISDPDPVNNGNTSRDHFAVVFNASVSKPPPVRKTMTY